MKTRILVLAVLFLAQLILTALLFHNDHDDQATLINKPLLANIDINNIDELLLEDDSGKQLRLRRSNDHWQLPAFDNLAADGDRIKGLLENLKTLPRGWPVANSEEAAKRFYLQEKRFKRRLTLKSKGQRLARLYLGTAPAFRTVHARLEGETSILAITLNTSAASTHVDDWLDHALLQMDQQQISTLELPGLRLQQGKKGLQLSDLKDSEIMKGDALSQLLATISQLRILGLALGQHQDQEAVLTITVSEQNGHKRRYRFFPLKKDIDYRLETSDQTYSFRVSAAVIDTLQTFKRSRLVGKKPLNNPVSPP